MMPRACTTPLSSNNSVVRGYPERGIFRKLNGFAEMDPAS
jgi:hypothetical protein